MADTTKTEEIHINIKSLKNDRGVLNVTLSSTDRIRDIKAQVEDKWSMPPQQQILIFNGRRFDTSTDATTLASSDITDGAEMTVIQVSVATTPSAPESSDMDHAPPTYESTINQGEDRALPLEAGMPIHLGLAWELLENCSVDLDATAVLFDAYGQVIDSVFYNQLKIMNGAVNHSGDCRNGEIIGDDEIITIYPHLLPPSVVAVAFVVNSYNTGSFMEVGHAMARVLTGHHKESEILRYAPACAGPHTGFVIGFMALHPNGWHFKALGTPAQGRNFEASMVELHAGLQVSYPYLHSITHYVPGQRFNMQKGETFEIPCDTVTMGLGWDPRRGSDMDVDASVIFFDRAGNSSSCVYWGNLAVPGVQHCGDNLTGQGDGDDEQIIIRLNQLSPNVSVLLFVVNIYTQNCVFRDVENEFCRLIDTKNHAELCRFEMDYMDEEVDNSNNLLMCKLFKGPTGKWEMQALGLGLRGPRTAPDLTKKILTETLTTQYQLNLPCCSLLPEQKHVKKKPRKQRLPLGGGDGSDGPGCACTVQ